MQIGAMVGNVVSTTSQLVLPVACLGALVATAVYISRDLWKFDGAKKAAVTK